jgi:hypothetical protein
MPRAVPLQRAEIVRVPQFRAQRLEHGPVVLLALVSQLAIHVPHQIRDDAIVVEQGVIDVEQCDKTLHRASALWPMAKEPPVSVF